ncbi:MAG: hypothetical protein JWO22_1252 [Frankiales bacterium]|nr:hypothetical protein [Frankiales bacterium]
MGVAADVAEGTVIATPTVTGFLASIPDVTAVDWTVVGEAVLLDVVTGVNTGE